MAIRRLNVHTFPKDQGAGIVEFQLRVGAFLEGIEWARARPGLLAFEDETAGVVTRTIRVVKDGTVVDGNPGTKIGHVVNDNGPDNLAYALVFFDLGES